MGGSTSKAAPASAPSFLQQAQEQLKPVATVSEIEAARIQAKALEAKALAEQAASAAQAQAAKSMLYLKSFGGLFLLLVILVPVLYLVDYIAIKYYNRSVIGLLKVITVTKEGFETNPEGQTGNVKKTEQRIVPVVPFFSTTETSGDLLPSLHDATTQSIVGGATMPLSSDKQGGYGMQWWMFINDWNYGYGKEKTVLSRVDPTNANILNPKVSLHPTDNTLKVSVSVFPETEGGSSTTEPAPAAGATAATDDVFICEVRNLPLQTWFAVSLSVFGRNLDIYIDGKLVKSCLLSGIPKPALGDVALSPDGGFSGYMCNFNYFARMLTPQDTSSFFSAGTACRDKVPQNGSGGGTAGTGYAIKFGVYDTAGKVVNEYKF
jgi:hypothetical protein